MEIHKPKPIHNWREFLKEVGTIRAAALDLTLSEKSELARHP